MTDQTERLYERILILRCQAGDEPAFAEVVERYSPRLRYYLCKMLGNHHAAEDALQEVWLDVFRSLPRLADVGAFTAWVYRIARDRAFRTARQRRDHCSLVESDEPADREDGPDFSAADAEAIHRALDELAAEHREVLVLRFLEEMSYEDIARVAGCELGTVRSRLHYAKRALRRVLEARCQRE
jgi:RNA polymerase sigma-70 factor (ECF subfamily)